MQSERTREGERRRFLGELIKADHRQGQETFIFKYRMPNQGARKETKGRRTRGRFRGQGSGGGS